MKKKRKKREKDSQYEIESITRVLKNFMKFRIAVIIEV
jgi:hypothetical protein